MNVYSGGMGREYWKSSKDGGKDYDLVLRTLINKFSEAQTLITCSEKWWPVSGRNGNSYKDAF